MLIVRSPTQISPRYLSCETLSGRRLHIGLGSDIAGGTSVSILRAIADAIQVSKLYWRLVDFSISRSLLKRPFIWEQREAVPSLERLEALRRGMNLMRLCLMTALFQLPEALSEGQT